MLEAAGGMGRHGNIGVEAEPLEVGAARGVRGRRCRAETAQRWLAQGPKATRPCRNAAMMQANRGCRCERLGHALLDADVAGLGTVT